MKQWTAPKLQTPSPTDGPIRSQTEAGKTTPAMIFAGAALDMSWRLAIVVLVPIIGGYELDQRFNSGPLLTIVGVLLAGFGSAAVLWRQLQQFGPAPPAAPASRTSRRRP